MFNFFKKEKTVLNSTIPEIVVDGRNGNVNESYNRLKDNIIYYSDNGKNKVLQIESSVSGEGKSTVVANLAVSLVKSGKKVAVIDLDFRRPKMHKAFNVINFDGIVEYMLDECSEEALIKKTDYNVDVVNRGKAAYNASIIITSDKFKKLIANLREKYDIILLDCPPILQISDYMHIAKISDAVLFIVSEGNVSRSQVREAVSQLRRNNIEILGCVMTFVDHNNVGLRASDYYKYYGKYYGNYMSEK